MKRILSFIMVATLILTSSSIAFAKSDKAKNNGNSQSKKTTEENTKQQKNEKIKAKKQEFKIKNSPVIKYGKFKLPINPITKGMGATLTYVKETAVITIVRGTTTLVIDLKGKKVTVNDVEDTKSGIFTAKNDKKTTVLIKYIAKALGVKVEVDKDKVVVEVPGLDFPTNVTITPVGTTIVPNTLNSTTIFMTATASIKAGQATGGKAELYVGSKLVATDSAIAATDTIVTFTTADETPTNDKLKALIPEGGVVTVKLYNANNQSVISTVANPTLIVDYVAPTITSISSAMYYPAQNQLILIVTDVSANNDKVDVTKLTLQDPVLGLSYQLTDITGTGSSGEVNSANSLKINLGTTDKLAIAGYSNTNLLLQVSVGSLLSDAAGNKSAEFTSIQTIPVTVIN